MLVSPFNFLGHQSPEGPFAPFRAFTVRTCRLWQASWGRPAPTVKDGLSARAKRATAMSLTCMQSGDFAMPRESLSWEAAPRKLPASQAPVLKLSSLEVGSSARGQGALGQVHRCGNQRASEGTDSTFESQVEGLPWAGIRCQMEA